MRVEGAWQHTHTLRDTLLYLLLYLSDARQQLEGTNSAVTMVTDHTDTLNSGCVGRGEGTSKKAQAREISGQQSELLSNKLIKYNITKLN